MVRVLLEHGANVNLKDHQGVSPLARASELGDRLIKRILDVSRKHQFGKARTNQTNTASRDSKGLVRALITKLPTKIPHDGRARWAASLEHDLKQTSKAASRKNLVSPRQLLKPPVSTDPTIQDTKKHNSADEVVLSSEAGKVSVNYLEPLTGSNPLEYNPTRAPRLPNKPKLEKRDVASIGKWRSRLLDQHHPRPISSRSRPFDFGSLEPVPLGTTASSKSSREEQVKAFSRMGPGIPKGSYERLVRSNDLHIPEQRPKVTWLSLLRPHPKLYIGSSCINCGYPTMDTSHYCRSCRNRALEPSGKLRFRHRTRRLRENDQPLGDLNSASVGRLEQLSLMKRLQEQETVENSSVENAAMVPLMTGGLPLHFQHHYIDSVTRVENVTDE